MANGPKTNPGDRTADGASRRQAVIEPNMTSWELAPRDGRFVARIIDTVLVFIPMFLIFILFANVSSVAALAGGLVVYLLYFVGLMIRMDGQTPGKKLMDIQVVKDNGSPLSVGNVVGREFVYWLTSGWIGAIWLLFDKRRKGLHDHAAATLVILKSSADTKPKKLGEVEQLEARTFAGDAWRQFRKHKLALIAIGVLAVIILGVLIGPFFWTIEPEYIDIVAAYQVSSPEHPWGTDSLGRDTLARALQGGRVSLMIGISAMFVSISIGTVIGLVSGYFRRLDNPLMRMTDIFIALPQLPLLLVLMMLFREPLKASFGVEGGVFILMVSVIGGLQWMPTARLVRGEVLTVKSREFITAANAVGSRDGRILRAHILPNVMSPVIVAATFSVAAAIITESALSFLGLGFPPDFPTWGRLLFDGKDYLTITWTLVFWPGMLISMTVLCVNFIGDGLRDALDPRLRK